MFLAQGKQDEAVAIWRCPRCEMEALLALCFGVTLTRFDRTAAPFVLGLTAVRFCKEFEQRYPVRCSDAGEGKPSIR